MPLGAPVADAPAGYISFCFRFPGQCDAALSQPAAIPLDAKAWEILERVNAKINDSIWPENDQHHFGIAEYWTIPTDGYGSCHDYALAKRKELIDAGLPQRALRIAIVVTPNDERHAVLTVATDKGDYVLDNLNQDLRPWRDTGYRWVARQDIASASGWVSLNAPPLGDASLAMATTSSVR
jgi:predicted transglutaminase-like cysteine proteinase